MSDSKKKEMYFIDKINEIKDEFDYWKCDFVKNRDATPEERVKICENCLLNSANIDIYDVEDNIVTVNLCTLLDVMDNIYY